MISFSLAACDTRNKPNRVMVRFQKVMIRGVGRNRQVDRPPWVEPTIDQILANRRPSWYPLGTAAQAARSFGFGRPDRF